MIFLGFKNIPTPQATARPFCLEKSTRAAEVPTVFFNVKIGPNAVKYLKNVVVQAQFRPGDQQRRCKNGSGETFRGFREGFGAEIRLTAFLFLL